MEIMAMTLTGAIKSTILITVIGNNDNQDDNSKMMRIMFVE